jgi:hypothetical protein
LITSFDTAESDITEFAGLVREAISANLK